MTTTYDGDKFTGLRPWSDDEPDLMEGIYEDECWECDELKPIVGMVQYFGRETINAHNCADCVDTFEQDDAPEELAITLGDMSIDDYPEERSPSLTEEIFGGFYYR